MPQLDRIIIFSQIFWLFLVFTLLYMITTHFFLPKFLKSLKIRKQIIQSNDQEILTISIKTKEQQIMLKQIIQKNLILIEQFIKNEIELVESNQIKIGFPFIDEKIANVLMYNTLYCNNQLLNSVILFPKFLNLKIKLN